MKERQGDLEDFFAVPLRVNRCEQLKAQLSKHVPLPPKNQFCFVRKGVCQIERYTKSLSDFHIGGRLKFKQRFDRHRSTQTVKFHCLLFIQSLEGKSTHSCWQQCHTALTAKQTSNTIQNFLSPIQSPKTRIRTISLVQ